MYFVADKPMEQLVEDSALHNTRPRSTKSSHTLNIIKEMEETPFPLIKVGYEIVESSYAWQQSYFLLHYKLQAVYPLVLRNTMNNP